LTPKEIGELWDALYLRPHEIAELLEHVRTHARHDWIYPLACMAGHTGTRRSELIRMLASDVDFTAGSVTIREKKRVKGKRSTRRAPLTPTLRVALEAWLAVHPGGPSLFCQSGEVGHSKKLSRTHRLSERQGPGDDAEGPHGHGDGPRRAARAGAADGRRVP
jgi:integrase